MMLKGVKHPQEYCAAYLVDILELPCKSNLLHVHIFWFFCMRYGVISANSSK